MMVKEIEQLVRANKDLTDKLALANKDLSDQRASLETALQMAING